MQRTCYVYINPKGRNPQGIVDPEEYEELREEIIDALYDYVHPETGRKPAALARGAGAERSLGRQVHRKPE